MKKNSAQQTEYQIFWYRIMLFFILMVLTGIYSFDIKCQPVTITVPGSVSATVTANGETDWYQFYIPYVSAYANNTYTVGAGGTVGLIDCFIYIYESDMTTLIAKDENPDPYWGASIWHTYGVNKWYYLKVVSYPVGSSSGSYNASVVSTVGVPSMNLVIDAAAFKSTYERVGDFDLYRFYTGTTAGTYTIQTYGSLDTYMTLYDGTPYNPVLQTDDNDGAGSNALIAQSLVAGKTYSLNVSATGTGEYSIDVKSPGAALFLNVSTTSILLGSGSGTSGTFNITSNTSWSISDNASWLTVSPTSGSNNGTITVTATSANTGTSSRSATVTVSGTGVTNKTVTVTQAAALYLNVSTTNVSIGSSSGSTGTFNITSNTSWSITDNAAWLTVSPASGSNNGTITVTATSANTGSASRSATVTVSGTGVSNKTVTVTQDPQPSGNTLGNTTVYGSTSTQNYRRAIQVTFPEAGTIQSLSIYHNGGSGSILMGVYSNSSTAPATRLGVTPATAVNAAAGWQTVTLTSPVSVTSGQTIWLAWVFENTVGVRYTTGTPARAQSTATWSGGMPTTFGTAAFANYKYSVYCTYTPGGTSTSTLGNTTVYSSTSTQNYRRAIQVTFPEAGTIQSLSIYHNGGSGSILMGIYSNSSTAPATRLGVTPATTVNGAAGWQTISLSSPVSVTSGQTVWLAWVFETTVGVRYTTGTPVRAQSTASWSGGMPTTFGTAAFANYKYSVYCTYTPGGTSTSTLGNTTVYSSTSTQNYRRAIPVTFTEAGTIQSLSIYHNGGSGSILMGVYSNSSTAPATRLGVTPATAVNGTAGWQMVTLSSPVSVTSGQTVWLAWVFENTVGVRYTTGTPARAQSTATWSGGMPTTFGTASFANYKYSVYCTYTPGGTSTSTLGNTSVYGSTSTQNYRRAIQVTFPEAGTIQSLSIYHNGGSGSILMGVYSNSSTAPATRLGVTPATAVNAAAGWQTVTLTSPVSVTSGQTVWLAWVFENTVGVRYTTGTPARAQSTASWSGGMPTTFGTAAFANYKYSVYCTYVPGGGVGSNLEGVPDEIKSSGSQTGINAEYLDKEEVLIYPNPTDGELTITWKNRYSNRLNITIYNILGKAVNKVQTDPDVNEMKLDMGSTNSGLYLFELKDNENDLILNRSRIIRK